MSFTTYITASCVSSKKKPYTLHWHIPFTAHTIHSTYCPQQIYNSTSLFEMLTKALVLLALSITTLSLPTTNESLEKRASFPWIGYFDLADTYCQNPPISRAKLEDVLHATCASFESTTQRIGMWTSLSPSYLQPPPPPERL